MIMLSNILYYQTIYYITCNTKILKTLISDELKINIIQIFFEQVAVKDKTFFISFKILIEMYAQIM